MNADNLDLKKVYRLLPENRREKVDYYRFEKDKKLSAGVYLILKKLLDEENIVHPIFKTEKYGKAHIQSWKYLF